MAHEITATDSLFVARTPAWHGLGTVTPDVLCSADALRVAGIDWEVQQRPLFTSDDGQNANHKVEGWVANVRSDNGATLGIVGEGYKVVQNREAFAFTDALLGEGVRYESAGSLQGGQRVWLLAKLPNPVTILGDKVEPYLVFSNGHNGRNAVKVAITPVRVVCMNTLNMALDGAKRSWVTTHEGNIAAKLEEAQRTLEIAGKYLNKLDEEANRLEEIRITNTLLAELTVDLFPAPKDTSRLQLVRQMREDFLHIYNNAPDNRRFVGTGWGVMNAVTDFAGHRNPKRITASTAPTKFAKIIDGHPLVDRAMSLLNAAA